MIPKHAEKKLLTQMDKDRSAECRGGREGNNRYEGEPDGRKKKTTGIGKKTHLPRHEPANWGEKERRGSLKEPARPRGTRN